MTKTVEVMTSVERRRRWSRVQKEQIVAAVLEPGAVASEIARTAGIHASQLFRWRRQICARTSVPAAFTPVSITSADGVAADTGRACWHHRDRACGRRADADRHPGRQPQGGQTEPGAARNLMGISGQALWMGIGRSLYNPDSLTPTNGGCHGEEGKEGEEEGQEEVQKVVRSGGPGESWGPCASHRRCQTLSVSHEQNRTLKCQN